MPKRAVDKKFAKLFFSIFAVIFCLQPVFCQPSSKLHLDNLTPLLDKPENENFKARVLQRLLYFVENGFAKTYLLIYKELPKKSTDEKPSKSDLFSLLLICTNYKLTQSETLVGKRFFLEKIKQSLATPKSVIFLSQLNDQFRLFDNQELTRSFQSVIRLNWAKFFKDELQQKHNISQPMHEFLSCFPWLETEVKANIARTNQPVEKWEYVLKEGKSGENEDDFVLTKVK